MNAPARLPDDETALRASNRRDCYTQGMDPDGSPNGDFETTWLPGLQLHDALWWVARLREPRHEAEPCAFCPPTFGVSGYGNVCRVEGGQYVAWSSDPGSVDCTLQQAIDFIAAAFAE